MGHRDAGKRIGGATYIHRQYSASWPLVNELEQYLPSGWPYTLVKIKPGVSVTFIQCSEFDTEEEPAMGDAYLVKSDGSTRFMPALRDPWIYHHKWQMVEPGYGGFSYDASCARSASWERLDNVDRRRIGKKSYWEQNVLPRL